MRTAIVFRRVMPYMTAIAVVMMIGVLIAAIYFTLFDLEWIAFLAGVLIAAILAMVTRASRAEWTVARRTAQLQQARDKLTPEIDRRNRAETALERVTTRLKFVDSDLPVMMAYFDSEARCRYHNHAFGRWLGLRHDQLDGEFARKIFGDPLYADISADIKEAFAGRLVRQERDQEMPNGRRYSLFAQHLPHYGGDGKIAGVYALYTDLTGRAVERGADAADAALPVQTTQEMFEASFSEHATGWNNAADRIVEAIERDEFRLYCQRISPLDGASGRPDCYEILIRLIEEEENLMAPGAFLPIAEKYGLMPQLDRWVVRQVLKWVSEKGGFAARSPMLCINVSGPTIDDRDFPKFVDEQRKSFDVPGEAICFELDEPDVVTRMEEGARFVRRLRQQGCHAALTGFGRDHANFDRVRALGTDFLKIDGSVILNMLRNPVDLAKVTAINKVAHTIGVTTVAEFVENDETVARLRDLGVDFAQGFGISRPYPLEETSIG